MLTDAELVDGVVAGYDDAFAELYERHSLAAWRLGQTVTGNADDAADAVAEAFARVLVAVRAGHLDKGSSFRSYLLTATRNAALDNIRKTGRSRATESDIMAELESASPTPSERLSGDEEAALIAEAFRSLPERWRSVLWLTEVEEVATKEAARRLGLTPNGAAQLAVRARAGLRERFLQAHLRKTFEPECRTTVERLGAYVGGGLAPRDLAKVDQHLAGCSTCQARKVELEDVRTSLRRVALPAPIVAAGALGVTVVPAAVGGGGTVAKALVWAQQAWAAKVVAATAAGALALGTGGVYLNGANDQGPELTSTAPAAMVDEAVVDGPPEAPAPQNAVPVDEPAAGATEPAPPTPTPASGASPAADATPECPSPEAAVAPSSAATPTASSDDVGDAAVPPAETPGGEPGGEDVVSVGGVFDGEKRSESTMRELQLGAAVADLKARVALSAEGAGVGIDLPVPLGAPACSGPGVGVGLTDGPPNAELQAP